MRLNKGFTLIELMVALLLSSLLMITMLTLFKQVSFIGMSTTEDAEYEAQLEIGLLTVQRLIANAGYGLGQDDDIVVVDDGYAGNDVVFWRYAQDHQATPIVKECRGFGVKIGPTAGGYKHQLVLLSAPCTETNLVDEDWDEIQPIASVKSEQNTDAVFGFRLVSGACVPFGIEQGSITGNKRIVIEAIRKHDFSVGKKTRQVCFSNIKAP